MVGIFAVDAHCTVTVCGEYTPLVAVLTRPLRNEVSVLMVAQPCGQTCAMLYGPLNSAMPQTKPWCHLPSYSIPAGLAGAPE